MVLMDQNSLQPAPLNTVNPIPVVDTRLDSKNPGVIYDPPITMKLSFKLLLKMFGITILTFVIFVISGSVVYYPVSIMIAAPFAALFALNAKSGHGGASAGLPMFILLPIIAPAIFLIYGILNGYLIRRLTAYSKSYRIGIGLFILPIVLFLCSSYTLDVVKKAQVDRRVAEVIGDEKIAFTFVSSESKYWIGDGRLESVLVNFKVNAPKTGDYEVIGYLTNNQINTESGKGAVSPDATKIIRLTKGIITDLNFEFLLTPFTNVNYNGAVDIVLLANRKNITIDDNSSQPITSWPLFIIDTGKSGNYKKTKDYEKAAIYSINPFKQDKP